MRIDYLDTALDDTRAQHAEIIDQIEKTGLLYPVTIVDGTPLYDGAVSYPAIMRAVQTKLDTVEA